MSKILNENSASLNKTAKSIVLTYALLNSKDTKWNLWNDRKNLTKKEWTDASINAANSYTASISYFMPFDALELFHNTNNWSELKHFE